MPQSQIHYGRYVESETPITGVFSQNLLEYIHNDADNGIDPDAEPYRAESYRAESLRDFLSENPDSTEEDFDDSYIFDGYEQSCALIGFREVAHRSDRSDSDVHYEPDPDAEYSAIVGMGSYDAFNCVQVVASRYLIRAALCSPCFPGQADGDSPGPFLAFAVPPDVIGFNGEEDADALRARIFPAGTTEPAPTAEG
jgi:hypothetical protein